MLGRRAILDVPTVLIFLITLLALWKLRRVPDPALIVAAGAAGLLLHHAR